MSSSTTRKALAGAVAAVSLGVGGLAVAAVNPLGPAGAQAQEDGTSTEDGAATPEEGAEGRHRERPRFLEETVDALVADGTLTQDQGDAVTEGVQARAEEWREANPRPEGGRGHRGFGALRGAFDAAAEAIGIEPVALRDAVRDGGSIAGAAEEAGVARQDVVDAMVAAATESIDAAVADGKVDEERAATLKAELPDRIAEAVDRTGGRR